VGVTRILLTAARAWTDRYALAVALGELATDDPTAVLVEGEAEGGDRMGADLWSSWGLVVEPHPAKDHASPRARNQHMVNLGADMCATFALKWASGTGMCARMARRAGIWTYDYGISTAPR
jgi:hypothetical protein